jgi:hypothetical protein
MEKENKEGTGRHPHKSTEEPRPHHETGKQQPEDKTQAAGTASREQEEQREEVGKKRSLESSDLKEREYRDQQGNIRHHTRTYEEQHRKE